MMWGRRKNKPASEATAARIRAERTLEAIQGKTHRYRELGESLRQIREENDLRAAIATTFRGREL